MPVVFEQVFAEKPAGGVIPNPAHDIMPGTALDASGKPIKAYRLTKAVGSIDTTIQIEKEAVSHLATSSDMARRPLLRRR